MTKMRKTKAMTTMEEDDEDGEYEECKESNETDEARTIEDIRIAKKNAHRFKTASDYLEAAKCYTDKGDLQKAKELYIDAIDICEKYLRRRIYRRHLSSKSRML